MKAESELILHTTRAGDGDSAVVAPGWRVALPLTVAAIVAILAAYWRTAESIEAIWWRSQTYQHGFLIVPIVLVLIWARRRELARFAPRPDVLGLVLLAGAGLAWLVAGAGQVRVVQQYAMVAMIPAAVVALDGRRVALALAFPLGFLFLGVPVGESLIPPMMNWTTHFVVAGLQFSGIPVYRDGTFFNTTFGNWSIVEGCSGLRYLIAAVTVGILYAYLFYRKPWKRLLFVAFSVIVPIVANGLRAYTIVLIADKIDKHIALRTDHLIYGWVFFGVVIFIMFWIGSFWHDPTPERSDPVDPERAPRSHARWAATGFAALAILAAWPIFAAQLERINARPAVPLLTPPRDAHGWALDPVQLTVWRPQYQRASASIFDVYRKGNREVVLYLGYYEHQRRGSELVTSTNVLVHQKDPVWEQLGPVDHTVNLGQGPVTVHQSLLRSAQQRLLAWSWFRIHGLSLSNPYLAKLLLARDTLLGRGNDGAAVILATPIGANRGSAEQALQDFGRQMLPSIDAAIARAASGTSDKGGAGPLTRRHR